MLNNTIGGVSPTKHKKFGKPPEGHPINAESGVEEARHQPTAAAHNVKLTKSGTPFKLRSGNTTPFKLMGSSPAKLFGGLFGGRGGGGAFGGVNDVLERVRASKAAGQVKRAGGGGGFLGRMFGGKRKQRVGVRPHGDESHTGGGGAIGGNAPMDAGAEALPPEMQEEAVNINQPQNRGFLGNLASDIRLKENINKTGVSPSGIPIYEFNYIGDSSRYSGAMAQDLLETNPDAVSMDMSGYYRVNYNNIDVDMHLIN